MLGRAAGLAEAIRKELQFAFVLSIFYLQNDINRYF
jgi:hypothetical protein